MRKPTKAERKRMKANAAVGDDGYMLPPPDRFDIRITNLKLRRRSNAQMIIDTLP